MITSITPEQEALFPVYVDEWTKIGTCTDPLNFDEAVKAVCKAYRLVGLKEPTQFHVADSPISAIKLIRELDPSMTPSTILSDMIYGYNDAYWIAFYEFMRKEMGVQNLDQIEGLSDLAKHSGWLNVYEDVVVFQHRPEVIKFDENNRLHCQDGPAIRFRDGFSIYSWHGVQIPEEWLSNPSSLTPQIALTWNNMEQRRCACDILGWAKILNSLDAKVIDTDIDPEIGQLVEVDLGGELGREKFLRVLCGTGREFALPVPPEMKTALEANAWTFDISPDMLKNLEVRT